MSHHNQSRRQSLLFWFAVVLAVCGAVLLFNWSTRPESNTTLITDVNILVPEKSKRWRDWDWLPWNWNDEYIPQVEGLPKVEDVRQSRLQMGIPEQNLRDPVVTLFVPESTATIWINGEQQAVSGNICKYDLSTLPSDFNNVLTIQITFEQRGRIYRCGRTVGLPDGSKKPDVEVDFSGLNDTLEYAAAWLKDRKPRYGLHSSTKKAVKYQLWIIKELQRSQESPDFSDYAAIARYHLYIAESALLKNASQEDGKEIVELSNRTSAIPAFTPSRPASKTPNNWTEFDIDVVLEQLLDRQVLVETLLFQVTEELRNKSSASIYPESEHKLYQEAYQEMQGVVKQLRLLAK